MKKIITVLFLVLALIPNCFAINWIDVVTPLNKVVQVDSDSITEADGYYFYNIRNYGSDNVLTIQSNIKKGFSAKINSVSMNEYTGDYSSITSNKTQELEPVTYASVVHTCYKLVKELKTKPSSIQIDP